MFWEYLSMRIFFSLKKSRLKKTRKIDNEVRISKKAEMKRNFNRNQKRITLLDIQLSSLTSMVILRVPERSKLLQQMYLARAELNQLFTSNISTTDTKSFVGNNVYHKNNVLCSLNACKTNVIFTRENSIT